MSQPTTTEIKCYHCSTTCDDHSFVKDDKHFCCFGCQTVYEILHDNNMEDYYDLDESPGMTMRHPANSDFEFLDNVAIKEKLLTFSSESLEKLTFSIPAIHCSSCIWLLENLNSLNSGIIASQINFSAKKLSVSLDPELTSVRKVAELLSQLGYAPAINLESTNKSEQKTNRKFYLQIGLAGFCFGNIMLLSFPEYIGIVTNETLKEYFSYLNLLLSLPVILFSGQDYFITAYRGLREKIINIDTPIALGISALFLESTYQVLSHTGSGYFDSLAALVFFLLIGKWFQSKTYQGLSFERDYKSYFPLAIQLVKDNHNTESVPVYELKVGDTIEVRNQEIIPADALLLNTDAQIDYSFVTGEAKPVPVKSNEKVFAGGRLVGGAQQFKILKTASQSYLTQLWNDQDERSSDQQASRPLIDRISRSFTLTVLAIASVSAVVWFFIDPEKAPIIFTSVLIVACPCALALATPFTLGTAMNILGRNNFYIKNSFVIEKLWDIKHIVFDKTGTLTSTLAKEIVFKGEPLTSSDKSAIKHVVKNSVHPYSQMIEQYLNLIVDDSINVEDYQELMGKGITGVIKDKEVKIGSATFILGEHSPINATVSSGRIYLSINGVYKGYFQVINKWREGIDILLNQLKSYFKLSLLSGDNSSEAPALKRIFPKNSIFQFNQKPEQKANFIKESQNDNEKLMMLGDGLNDAVALKESHVGVAVTDNMSAFTPASDVILKGTSLNILASVIKFSKRAKSVIVISFIISFCYNVVGLGLAITGNLQPVYAAILMPLSSISVVVFSTLSIKLLAHNLKLH